MVNKNYKKYEFLMGSPRSRDSRYKMGFLLDGGLCYNRELTVLK